jgi:P27 family predicted phage terminase small subunit
LPDVVHVAGKAMIEMPDMLDDGAQEVWRELVPMLHDANLLDRVDAIALEGLCAMIARARHATNMIAEHGYTVEHAKTGVLSVSPWVRIERDAWKQAIALGEHYGLTPVARTRLGLAVLKGRTLMQELNEGLEDA